MYTAVHFSPYKSFSDSKNNSILDIQRVNVFIGKNNSGKSSLIDILRCVYDINDFVEMRQRVSDIEVDAPIQRQHIDSVFSGYSQIGNFRNAEQFWEKHSDLPPARISVGYKSFMHDIYNWEYKRSNDESATNLSNRISSSTVYDVIIRKFSEDAKAFAFRRLSAERNIVPELDKDETRLDEDGSGASNLIRFYVNRDGFDENIIEQTLLEALNEIMYPDSIFQAIRVQQIKKDDNLLWEVFLQEEGRERYALSQSGSGLKTIILLLLNLLVIPKTEEYANKKIYFGFEELENNLHPYLQRRTFEYIYNFALKEDIFVFLTTHSHVAINAFYGKEKTALYHITKEKGISQVNKIDNYIDKVKILDDLDVKASDLFQSNGIIWVEGPSDRIYINRWLEVFCDNKFIEGEHYQFLFYGGRNLSHYAYTDDEVSDLINILTTNRNASIVMDSDKKYENATLSNTKKRIIEEFEKLKMFAWTTEGKEIENYIPYDAINLAYSSELSAQCGQYELFPEYISSVRKNFSSEKVKFAHKVVGHICKDNSIELYGLEKQIRELYQQIESWNS